MESNNLERAIQVLGQNFSAKNGQLEINNALLIAENERLVSQLKEKQEEIEALKNTEK